MSVALLAPLPLLFGRVHAQEGSGRTSATAASGLVTVSASGIAARYPGDVGIENDPSIIFVEKFNESSLTAMTNRWTDSAGSMAFSTDVPAGNPAGSHSIKTQSVSGVSDGVQLYKVLQGLDLLYVRYYIKYPTNTVHHGNIGIGGNNPVSPWPVGIAGSKPSGSDAFIAEAEQNQNDAFDHYDYWMNMHPDAGGSYWGNWLLNDPNVKADLGHWMCVEQMVKLNNPTTAFNGEHAFWMNGIKISHLGLGFPNGTWEGGIFTQSPTGTPFEGFRWRNTTSLNINFIWLTTYSPEYSTTLSFSNVVAATSYIGCLTPSNAPAPPKNLRILP